MTELASIVTTPTPLQLRVEDYLRLEEAGTFQNYQKTELIEGLIYYMNSQYRPHAQIKSDLFLELALALRSIGSKLKPLVEVSISIPPHDVPEPDIVVTSELTGVGLIALESVILIVEVADTTLANDLGRKQRVYASNSVPEYWVVDVNARVVHQMANPSGDAYLERRMVGFGEPLRSIAIRDLIVPTAVL